MQRPTILGHVFYCGEVLPIYLNDAGKACFFDQEEIPFTHYKAGVDWYDLCPCVPLAGEDRERMERVAFHEAGHAGMALDSGIDLEYVLIRPKLYPDGFCRYRYDLNDLMEAGDGDWRRKFLIATLGAAEAEKEYLRRKGLPETPMNEWSWTGDERQVREAAEKLGVQPGEKMETFVAGAKQMVRERLRDPVVWSGIERIAGALLDQRAIGGKSVKGFFTQPSPEVDGQAAEGASTPAE